MCIFPEHMYSGEDDDDDDDAAAAVYKQWKIIFENIKPYGSIFTLCCKRLRVHVFLVFTSSPILGDKVVFI